MRVLLSMYGWRGDMKPIVELAVQPGTEECCRPVATGVMSTGVWQ